MSYEIGVIPMAYGGSDEQVPHFNHKGEVDPDLLIAGRCLLGVLISIVGAAALAAIFCSTTIPAGSVVGAICVVALCGGLLWKAVRG
jgi:hypothetical protein